jgi:hypothetical protein
MKKALTFLFLAVSAALFSSCVTDDYDYGYGNSGYYGQPPPARYDNRYYYDDRPPPPRYDDRYRDDRYYRDDRRHHDRHQHDRPQDGEFQAGGGAKEYAFPAGYSRCTITILDGSVGFNTIVIRAGGAKRSQTIGAKFQRGQSFNVPIDRNSTGLRISDTGRGRYRVSVR